MVLAMAAWPAGWLDGGMAGRGAGGAHDKVACNAEQPVDLPVLSVNVHFYSRFLLIPQ